MRTRSASRKDEQEFGISSTVKTTKKTEMVTCNDTMQLIEEFVSTRDTTCFVTPNKYMSCTNKRRKTEEEPLNEEEKDIKEILSEDDDLTVLFDPSHHPTRQNKEEKDVEDILSDDDDLAVLFDPFYHPTRQNKEEKDVEDILSDNDDLTVLFDPFYHPTRQNEEEPLNEEEKDIKEILSDDDDLAVLFDPFYHPTRQNKEEKDVEDILSDDDDLTVFFDPFYHPIRQNIELGISDNIELSEQLELVYHDFTKLNASISYATRELEESLPGLRLFLISIYTRPTPEGLRRRLGVSSGIADYDVKEVEESNTGKRRLGDLARSVLEVKDRLVRKKFQSLARNLEKMQHYLLSQRTKKEVEDIEHEELYMYLVAIDNIVEKPHLVLSPHNDNDDDLYRETTKVAILSASSQDDDVLKDALHLDDPNDEDFPLHMFVYIFSHCANVEYCHESKSFMSLIFG